VATARPSGVRYHDEQDCHAVPVKRARMARSPASSTSGRTSRVSRSSERSGRRVGIVSNGMADNQLANIERSGVGERVDACCVSGEVGIRKPNVRIFELAAERCGTDLAAGGRMIGDSPEHDLAGGRAAGLRTMWPTARFPMPWPRSVFCWTGPGRPADHGRGCAGPD